MACLQPYLTTIVRSAFSSVAANVVAIELKRISATPCKSPLGRGTFEAQKYGGKV